MGYAFAWVLSAIAVIKTAVTQRKIKRIISAVQVWVHFSEVLFAPLRLKQKTSEPSLRKVVLFNNRTLFLRSLNHDEPS
jgi:hypothetical protein